MLNTIALVIHILISIALVLVILAQTSKGGLDANLGGAAMNVFGGSGASKFLRKWTQILGVVFAISCLFLALRVANVNEKASDKDLGTFGTANTAGQSANPATTPSGNANQANPSANTSPQGETPAGQQP